jgi:hypothetical protein
LGFKVLRKVAGQTENQKNIEAYGQDLEIPVFEQTWPECTSNYQQYMTLIAGHGSRAV